MRARLTAIIVALTLTAGSGTARQDVPDGLQELTDDFWTPPWVLDQRGAPLPALHHATPSSPRAPFQIQLDDGSRGTLRVESRPCAAGEDCTPFDCGCPLQDESHWIEIVDSAGGRIARLHLWAAYGVFDLVPVDLIDGPGDELIIIRIPAHSSPPAGHDVKIWKPGRVRPVELLEPTQVAGLFDSHPIGCARWRAHLVVDVASPKPRALAVRTSFAASPRDGTSACRLNTQGAAHRASLQDGRELRFSRGRYRH